MFWDIIVNKRAFPMQVAQSELHIGMISIVLRICSRIFTHREWSQNARDDLCTTKLVQRLYVGSLTQL